MNTRSEEDWLAQIMRSQQEAWCHEAKLGWLVLDLSDPANLSEVHPERVARIVADGASMTLTATEWQVLELTGGWRRIYRSSYENAAEFKKVFIKWRAKRKEEKKGVEQEHSISIKVLEELTANIPRIAVAERHRLHAQVNCERYIGVRTPEENTATRWHRKAHCWNCHRGLDNYMQWECKACGWILCECGACGCGQLQAWSSCPRCGANFRSSDSYGNTPYCSTRCRVEALQNYSEYLATPEWASRRALRLKRDANVCQDCGEVASEVHHLTYEHIGVEELDDLISLCKRCHAIRHGFAMFPQRAKKVQELLRQASNAGPDSGR